MVVSLTRPLKQAVVGQVMTVWPMRSISRLGRSSLEGVNSNTLKPGRPSGVSVTSPSIPASHLQPITEVAKPVIFVAASSAHLRFLPVMITRVPHILKPSAKVSSISTPLM